MKGWPYKEYPTSWFMVARSSDIAPGQVVPLEFLGQELVMYRTESGEVNIFDAFCPHFGAHLGHGGCVVGETLQCPWHGWKWSLEGRNVEIPFVDSPNRQAQLKRWHVRERDYLILMWHDSQGRDPWWEWPGIPEFRDPEHYYQPDEHPDGTHCYGELRVNPQLPIENAADPMHFAFVHGSDRPAKSDVFELKDEYLRSVFKVHFGGGKGSTWLTPDGDTWGTIEAEQWGLGIGVARFNIGPLQVAQSIAVTPIDHIRSTAWSTIAATRDPKCADPAQGPAGVMMTEQVRQVRRDFFIWENQRYVTKPLYVLPEEHNFFELRKWFRQFYTEAAVDQTDDAAAVHLAMP
jgi:phenylpropionate dioxygenase-like ring-hydroxylating dioxygenase large terminal subunit